MLRIVGMTRQVYQKELQIGVSRERLWEWHMRSGAFERLSPPWIQTRFGQDMEIPRTGEQVAFEVRQFGIWLTWRARIDCLSAPFEFVDTQVEGPFAYWRHRHIFSEAASQGSTLTDAVTFEVPRPLSWIPVIRDKALKEIERLFAFRHQRTHEDLQRYPIPRGSGQIVLVTGASGMVGRRLVPFLKMLGYAVRTLGRSGSGKGAYRWNPETGNLDTAALEGVSAVIHLAGEPIAAGRWDASRKSRIMKSRVAGTQLLVDTILQQINPPSCFICASGVNYYGSGTDPKTEDAPNGKGFLAEVCRQWEAAAKRVEAAGVRCLCVRAGVVLDPLGGALAKMLPAFLCGVGGPVGSGEQRFPWISIDDLLDIFAYALEAEKLTGGVNAVHPQLVTQREFAACLGRVLRRPACLPLPTAVVRLLFGEMGEETLLADLPIRPGILEASGYAFRSNDLESALRLQLGRTKN
jgi:hypothetical protein